MGKVGARCRRTLASLLLAAGAWVPVMADGWTDANPGGLQMVADRTYQAFYGTGRVPRTPGALQLTLHRAGGMGTVVLSVPGTRKELTLVFRPRPAGLRQGAAVGEVADLWSKEPLVIHGIVFKHPVLFVMGKPGQVALSDGMGPNALVWCLPGFRS